MAFGDDGSQSVSSQPLLWVIIPLLAVFSAGCFTTFVWTRHRRARQPHNRAWPENRLEVPDDGFVTTPTRRWANWIATRSLEGLNELGEAPPPYDAKCNNPPPPLLAVSGVGPGAAPPSDADADAPVRPPELRRPASAVVKRAP